MARLAWVAGALALCVAAAAAPARGLPRPEEAWCRGVTCSGHGTCMVEGSRPFCFCEDGYAADGRSCVPVPVPRSLWTARRSPAAGERVVSIASAYVGADAWGVGGDLRAPPFGLRRYVWRGEQWCTELVSWAYRAGGVPLTGGSEGGWMIRNNRAMRAWFVRHDLWVGRDDARRGGFEPLPGDYVRFHTTSGVGHSGIVRRVAGDTLYTVEGNVGNRVRLRRFERYASDRRIDGFGMLTLPGSR